MAEKPISTPLPADLPTNWQTGQTVSPTGTEVGLTQQHGYNYQSQQINNAQTAINTINDAFENVYGDGDTVPVADGGTGAKTPQEALVNLGAASNPNLLDNWYFVGGGSQQGGGQFPINQRGQTSYTGIGYGIDRWKIVNSDSALSITNAGMTIANSTTSGDGIICVGEFIEPSQITIGAVYTVSVLVSGTSGNGQWKASPSFIDPSSEGNFVLSGAGLFSATFIAGPPINQDNWYFYFWKTAANTEDSITIQAVKLELGTIQTLAHQDADGNWVLNDPPPNFQQELAKCQRYYLKTVSNQYYPGCMFSSTNGVFLIPTPVQMRSTPAFSLVSGATLRCYDNTPAVITTSNISIGGCDATGIKITLSGIQGAKDGTASFTDGNLEFSADL